MNGPAAAAVADTSWLEPDELYLATGDQCELSRPIFQGDIFADVSLPVLPKKPPEPGKVEIEFVCSLAMVVPHPCQCYYGNQLRPVLTVAPVSAIDNFDKFGDDRSGARDKFALPDLPAKNVDGAWKAQSSVADFGSLVSVKSSYLKPAHRVACLSHKGLGLLAKRVAGFQTRLPIELSAAMTFVHGEWNESFLMQAWVEKYRSLRGYTEWMREPTVIPGVNDGEPIAPYNVRASALDALLSLITGRVIPEQ